MTNIKIYSQARNVLIYYLEAYMSGPAERRAWGLKPPPPPPPHTHTLLKNYIEEN